MKCAIFSCMGLGDGLITLVLAHNLQKHGADVVMFHPFLEKIQSFFPHIPLKRFPQDLSTLATYDRLFIVYEKSSWMREILEKAQREFPKKTTILNPIATPHCDYSYWEEGRFDGNLPFAENLYRYCRDLLKLEKPTRENGIVLPDAIEQNKYQRRVIIHPTSSRKGKNWTKEKFIRLSQKLQKDNFDPVFILTKEEKKQGWPEVKAPEFKELKELAIFVAESGWMIGNDSGIGHLASLVGVPTLTICRSRTAANFWRPAWTKGEVIVPPKGIPNLKGMRLKDKKWQFFISVNKVYKTFKQMMS